MVQMHRCISCSKNELSLPRRVAHHSRAGGNVAGHHAAGADDGVGADGDAGKDDGAAADPDVLADPGRNAVLLALPSQGRIARVVGGEDLDPGAELAAIANAAR
jgi:hypothetical protein